MSEQKSFFSFLKEKNKIDPTETTETTVKTWESTIEISEPQTTRIRAIEQAFENFAKAVRANCRANAETETWIQNVKVEVDKITNSIARETT